MFVNKYTACVLYIRIHISIYIYIHVSCNLIALCNIAFVNNVFVYKQMKNVDYK